METKVTFITVKDNPAKLNAIVQTVQEQLDHGKRILIAVPNQEAATFVDQLLWKSPEQSFSPHVIATASVNELVVITSAQSNLNKAQVLINLNPQVSPISNQFEAVFDLYDQTHPSKEQLSLDRQEAYKKMTE